MGAHPNSRSSTGLGSAEGSVTWYHGGMLGSKFLPVSARPAWGWTCLALLLGIGPASSQETENRPNLERLILRGTELLKEIPSGWTERKRFSERSKASSVARIQRRLGTEKILPDYKLADESFQIYRPENFNKDEEYGLFVWINALPVGYCSAAWRPVFDRHKLIFIGADNSGNVRPVHIRFGLALDAVHHMQKAYHIDPERIYVSGPSGGGRAASVMGVLWGDIFDGAFPMIGCKYYQDVASPVENAQAWPASFRTPPERFLQYIKGRNRYVFLTGEFDFNRRQMEATALAYKGDKFQHIDSLVVPGLGHWAPDAHQFDAGIILLDKPLNRPDLPATPSSE
ncbi:MAG: hypothetical protein ACI9TH_004610 [Kiritimatiellia bacterium]|jgi:hypothetical protein